MYKMYKLSAIMLIMLLVTACGGGSSGGSVFSDVSSSSSSSTSSSASSGSSSSSASSSSSGYIPGGIYGASYGGGGPFISFEGDDQVIDAGGSAFRFDSMGYAIFSNLYFEGMYVTDLRGDLPNIIYFNGGALGRICMARESSKAVSVPSFIFKNGDRFYYIRFLLSGNYLSWSISDKSPAQVEWE